jgi:hypothetical protein
VSDAFQSIETVVVAFLIAAYAVIWLIRSLGRHRPEFDIATPIAVGFGVRLLAIAGIASTGLSSALRGGDETTFLTIGRHLANQPFGRGWWPHGQYQLHVVTFALQLKLGGFTQGALRITQVGLAMVGLVLILAAVHDLAGGRPTRLAAWILALEPAAIFFNGALHKEPLMELAAGLVVFGGSKVWRRLGPGGILLCALGGLIAVETRSYAGWFLVSASILLLLHAALRQMNRPFAAMPIVYAVAVIAFIATPVVLQASSKQNLQQLQVSQNANTVGVIGTPSAAPNGNNLALEKVNFTTRGSILSNLPQRIRDVILRPYPWQLHDSSQRFGAIGTLIAYGLLLMLVSYAWRSRGRVFPLTAPFLYPLLFLLVAYSLSAGNAGTGFRYRTHLVTLAIAMMIVLREHAHRSRAGARVEATVPPDGQATRPRELVPAGG